MNIIGTDIRLRREKVGISLRSFAQSVGISAGYLSQVERGQQLPSLDMIERIYSFLMKDTDGRLENTIFKYPGVLLLLQRYAEIVDTKGPDLARFVAVIYVTALYVGVRICGIELEPRTYSFKASNDKEIEIRPKSEISYKQLILDAIQQYLFEAVLTIGLDQIGRAKKEEKNLQTVLSEKINSGYKISDIARTSQLTENYIQQILNGIRNPSIKTKKQLIETLQLDLKIPEFYGIPEEYVNNPVIERIINITQNVATLAPNDASSIINFAILFTNDNITESIFTTDYPDIIGAHLAIDCLSEAINIANLKNDDNEFIDDDDIINSTNDIDEDLLRER